MKQSKWRKRLKSFGFRITAFNIIAGLLIVSLFGAVVYVVVSDIFVKESIAKTEMAIEKTAVEIGADIRHAKSLLRLLTTTPAFMDYAANGADEAAIIQLMNAITAGDSYVFGVFAAFSDGRLITQSKADTLGEDYQTLLSYDMPFLTTARAGDYAHDDGCVITMGVPIELDTGEMPGVLAMDLDYCMIGNAVGELSLGGVVEITDPAGAVIFETGTAHTATGTAAGYDPSANVLTHSHLIPETQWTLTGRVYLSGLDILKRQLLDIVALTGVLLFLALVLIAAAYSRKLSTPVARLADSMEDIESLRELAVLAGEVSETRTLTESYNRMIRKIRQLMAELAQKQEALRQTEIQALTHQINPHFLYNTLDTIVWLAEFKDNDKIIALTKSLARFFRLSLAQGNAVVSLQDEAAHAEQYLYIQKERYGERLTYSIDIPDALKDCMVPKIILQPIVENSLYHGIKPMDGIGRIDIAAKQQGEMLLLSVTDNGVGFDPAATPHGVGLKNVESRIKLYYGEDAGIDIHSQPGKGAAVLLRLKMHLPDAAGQESAEGEAN